MNVLIGILVPLGLVILGIFHTSHTDDDGVPRVSCENRVKVAEVLIAALLALGLVKLVGAPEWGALGVVGLGLYIQDVRIGLLRSIRKRALIS